MKTKRLQKSDETVIVNTDIISFNVKVTDSHGRHIAGLNKEAFTIFDNNIKQDIEYFSDEDAPASVCFIFDYSASMAEKIRRAKQALARFMENGHEDDDYILIGFNDRVRVLTNWTHEPQEILDKLVYANPKGNTAFFDACYVGISKLMRSTNKKKVVLLISDGQDNNSRYTIKDLKNLLRETDISIYSISIQNNLENMDLDTYAGWMRMKDLSEMSGGAAFLPKDVWEFDSIFDYIALDIRSTYSIGYRPNDFQADGKWRKVKVRVAKLKDAFGVSVRTRAGYYAGLSK